MDNRHLLQTFIKFIETLEEKGIYYELGKIRTDAVMITVAVPRQLWEIEFHTFGELDRCNIEIEKYISDGRLYDESELDVLFKDFVD